MTTDIALDTLILDHQIRRAIDSPTVHDYADAMRRGDHFPPIVVFSDDTQTYLADGFHRVHAAKLLQAATFIAEIRSGTRQDALWYALGANRTSGLRLNEQDKQHAVALALRAWPDKMQREIAEQIGCSQSLVSKVASEITKNAINTGGVPVLTGKARRSVEMRERIRDMVEAGAESQAIVKTLHVHSGIVAEVRRALGKPGRDQSRQGIRARREELAKLAEEGHTARQIATALGITEESCRAIAREQNIPLTADRVLGKVKRPQANRILEQIVLDAQNLTEGLSLVQFDELDPQRLGDWRHQLEHARRQLSVLIQRLLKEQQRHGEIQPRA